MKEKLIGFTTGKIAPKLLQNKDGEVKKAKNKIKSLLKYSIGI